MSKLINRILAAMIALTVSYNSPAQNKNLLSAEINYYEYLMADAGIGISYERIFFDVISINPSVAYYSCGLNTYPFNRYQFSYWDIILSIYPFQGKEKLKNLSFGSGYRDMEYYYKPDARIGASLMGVIPLRISYIKFFGEKGIFFLQGHISFGIGLYGDDFNFDTHEIEGGYDYAGFDMYDMNIKAGIAF